jgi:hypothetical protein
VLGWISERGLSNWKWVGEVEGVGGRCPLVLVGLSFGFEEKERRSLLLASLPQLLDTFDHSDTK